MFIATLLLVAGPPAVGPAAAPPAPAAAAAPAVVEEPPAPAPAAAVAPQADDVRGMDARMGVLSDQAAFDLKRLSGDHRLQTFAVVPFDEAGVQAKERRLGLVVSDLVITRLARNHHLALVERAALSKIMDEQALGQTGAIDEKQAASVGKLAGARALVLGTVSDVPEGFRVSIRCVDAETGEVMTAHDAVLPGEELTAYSEGAVVLRSRSGAFFRSLVAPGWGQLYNDEPIKAAALGGLTGVLAVGTLATAGLGFYTGYVVYPNIGNGDGDPKDKSELPAYAQTTRETADAQLVAAGVLVGLTATAWLGTALDAYLSGHDVESRDDALASR